MLDNAEDELDRLLVYSGIPSIEIAINEYLEKYAITTKVEQAVNTFIGYINSKDIEGNLIDTLMNDAERARVLLGEDIKKEEYKNILDSIFNKCIDINKAKMDDNNYYTIKQNIVPVYYTIVSMEMVRESKELYYTNINNILKMT